MSLDIRWKSWGCIAVLAGGIFGCSASSSSLVGPNSSLRVAGEGAQPGTGTHAMRLEDLLATLSRPTLFGNRVSELESTLRRGCSLTGKDGEDPEYDSRSYSCTGNGLKSASLIVWKGRNAERLQELVVEFEPSRYEAVLRVIVGQLGSPSEADGEAAFWRSFPAKYLPASAGQPVISVQRPIEGQGNAVFSAAFENSEP